MAPSLISAVTGTALFATQVFATKKSYQQIENWGVSNFFDKFDFFESKVSSLPNRYDIDPTGGFVNYRNSIDAHDLGLWGYDDKDGLPFIGVDYTNKYDENSQFGRSSVRLESKDSFGKGLFVFDIAHLPKTVDGAWPAIWTYGDWVDSYNNWPKHGDIDIYENWNKFDFNRQTLHTTDGCWIKNDDSTHMTNTMDSYSCNYQENSYFQGTRQYTYQGCSSHEGSGTFGNSDGGVYVVEWTDDSIKMWSFRQGEVPSDVSSGKPDPSTWEDRLQPGLLWNGWRQGQLLASDRYMATEENLMSQLRCQ
ncbi:hypothetical protein E8E14_002652 [Neopestalotiopsis sp. 37M]|nr:hypothetical protein E8E14_002652 [Neopestalotiopsis sp. 37M]